MEQISNLNLIHYLLSSYIYGISRTEYQLTGRHGVFSRVVGEAALKKAGEMMGLEVPEVSSSELFEEVKSLLAFFENAGGSYHKVFDFKKEDKRLEIAAAECPFRYACRKLLDEGRQNLTCFYTSMILNQLRKKNKKIRNAVVVNPGNCQITFEKND